MTAAEKYRKRWTLRGYQPPLLKPKAPLRVVLAVLINITVFAATTMFLGYLRTGRWLDFSQQTFQADMASPTADIFIQPLGVLGHPWMIIVFAILLGILTFVPLGIAVMYQLMLSLMLTAMIAVFGHCPFFALSLAVGCLLAARTNLRRSWPLGAMLLGMLPVAIFWYLLAYPGLDTTMLDAIQRWIIIVTITATLIFAIANALVSVTIVRVRKFQPGAIWPLLFIALTCSISVFYLKITPAELEYQLIARGIDNDQTIFNAQPRKHPADSIGLAANINEERLNALAALDKRKEMLDLNCHDFLRKFPNSKRAASVIWLRGTIANLQLDTSVMDDKFISYTTGFIQPLSETYWQELLESYPNSDQAALAQYNLAILKLRKIADEKDDAKKLQLAKQADRMLNKATINLHEIVSLQQQQAGDYNPVDNSVKIPSPQTYGDVLFEAQKLTWQILDNEILTNPVAAEAMSKYLAINPSNSQYDRKIKRLAADPKYANCPFSDNLQLAVAKLYKNPYDRAEALIKLANDKPNSDAAIEANYELGRISMQTANARLIGLILKDAEYYFQQVATQRYNPWMPKAVKLLEWRAAAKARQQSSPTQTGN